MRLTKMKEEECIICMLPMANPIPEHDDETQIFNHDHLEALSNPTDFFMLTPCKHKFHKQCLLKWMK